MFLQLEMRILQSFMVRKRNPNCQPGVTSKACALAGQTTKGELKQKFEGIFNFQSCGFIVGSEKFE